MKIQKEFVRFCVVSTMAGTTDFSFYYLSKMFLPVDISKGISFIAAGIVGYFFNKYWTFSQSRKSRSETVRYSIAGLFLLGFNVSVNRGILLLWPGAIFPAVATASLSTTLVSFVLKKVWVFKKVKAA